MSTLKVNKLRDTAGSTDAITLDPNGGAVLAGVTTMTTARVTSGIVTNTFTVGAGVTISESGIEASGIGITCANINGAQIGGRRNLVINGAMQVAQRGTSSDVSSTAYGSVDRFQLEVAGLDNAVTMAQVDVSSGTTPYTEGFRKALKLTNGDQTSVGNTDTMRILYKFEAQDVATSGWNYKSSSSFITLSFWIKSSVAQSFKISLITWDGSARTFGFDTGSLSADTWTKITKVIPGDSNNTIDFNNDKGLELRFYQYLGTNYTQASGYPEDAWTAYQNPQTAIQTSTWYDTNDATYEITGVQLEVGSQATPFEHRMHGEEIALCQRYFSTVRGDNQQRTNIPAFANSTTSLRAMVSFPTPMRATPTFSGSATNMVFDASDDSATFLCSALTQGGSMTNNSPHGMLIEVSTSSMTAGQAGVLEFRADNGELNFSAEL